MQVDIKQTPISFNLHGFSATAVNSNYAATAFKLMDAMWAEIKKQGLKHKGLNIWVYEPGNMVFAGVELEGEPKNIGSLQQKNITLAQYAYHKHIGPYSLIKNAGVEMRAELKNQGLTPGLPYIEVYGHWQQDETKLETELLMAVV